jgi:hypothetical protein
MIKALIFLLNSVPYSNNDIKIARGRYKFPENYKEYKRYLKFRINE